MGVFDRADEGSEEAKAYRAVYYVRRGTRAEREDAMPETGSGATT